MIVARRAHASLALGQTKDAAWLALYGWESGQGKEDADHRAGVALSLAALGRILMEVNEDPLATIGLRHALALGVPEPERAAIERFHRIDLWTRGLLRHQGGATVLKLADFFHGGDFEVAQRFDPWFEGQLADWSDEAEAVLAMVRMSAALADAWVVPPSDSNPLRVNEGWSRTPAYEAWCAQSPAAGEAPEPQASEPSEAERELTVLSDYWIEQEIASLGASGSFDMALERAQVWASLRPQKIRPRAAWVRLLDAAGQGEARDRVVAEILGLGVQDLSDLEEARVALGELRLWIPQIELLDQMERLAPGHPVILANRGAARLELDEMEQGIKDLEGALAADPENGPALATLGLVRMRQDEYVQARHLLERAVKVAPDQAQVRLYLAACKNNQGDRQAAVEELEEAIQLEPDNAQALQMRQEIKEKFGI